MTFITALTTALKGKEILQKTISTLGETMNWVKQKSHTHEIGEIDQIAQLFFDERISCGEYVIGQGYFSEYTHTYKPLSYMPTIPGVSNEKNLGYIVTPQGLRGKAQTHTTITSFPLPIESLPNMAVSNGVIRLGFIYPKEFSGFIYPPDPEKEKNVAQYPIGAILTELPNYSKPIPVIFPSDISNQLLGRIVTFKAKITEIPFMYFSLLTQNLGDFSSVILNNAYRPFNRTRKTLCLNLLDDKCEIKQAADLTLNHIKGALFLESHLDGYTPSEKLDPLITHAIPETVNFPKIMNYPPYLDFSPFITTGKVRVIFRKPNIFGFYIETDLNNSKIYSSDIGLLRDFYYRTGRNIQNIFADNGHKRYKMKLDKD